MGFHFGSNNNDLRSVDANFTPSLFNTTHFSEYVLKQPSEEWSATFSLSKYLWSLIFHNLHKLDTKSHSITHTRPKSLAWFSELSFWCADRTSQLEDAPFVQSANFACNVYLMIYIYIRIYILYYRSIVYKYCLILCVYLYM